MLMEIAGETPHEVREELARAYNAGAQVFIVCRGAEALRAARSELGDLERIAFGAPEDKAPLGAIRLEWERLVSA
jgi:hypothetical protein